MSEEPMKPAAVRLSERLRYARTYRKLSRRKLGELTGLSRSTIEHYEYAVNEPGAYSLKALCDALDMSADWLLGRTQEGGHRQ